MKLPRLLFIIAALASSALAQTAGVTKSLASASLNEITGDIVFPSGKTLTVNGTLSGTPAGGTLNLSAVTLTPPSNVVTLTGSQTLTNKTLTSPSLTTPNIGAATGTSVNLSGAGTFGGNLTVSGTTNVADVYSPTAGATWGADSGATGFQLWGTGGGANANKLKLRVASTDQLTITSGAATLAGNLTVSGGTVGTAALTNLTLSGGSSGANLVLGQGANGSFTFTLPNISAGSTTWVSAGAAGIGIDFKRTTATATVGGTLASLNGYNGATRSTIFEFNGDGATDSGRFDWWVKPTAGSLTQVMTLKSSGNLLIGTTTDGGQKLQVSGTGYFAGALLQLGDGTADAVYRVSASNGKSTDLGDDTTGGFLRANNSQSVRIITGGTTALTLDGSQNATFAGRATVSSTTASTSTTTGALVVSGGVGLAGQVNAQALNSTGTPAAYTSSGGLVVAGYAGSPYSVIKSYSDGSGTEKALSLNPVSGNVLIGGTTDISGSGGLKVFGTTASTSTTSGALQVAGGVGVAGNIYSGGAMIASGTSTSTGYNNNANAQLEGPSGRVIINHINGQASGTLFAGFGYNGSGLGSITQDGTSAVLYNTTSDARLKENVRDVTNSGAIIDGLKPRVFDWKKNGDKDRFGFLAQEVHAVFPQAVKKGDDGEEVTDAWAMDAAKLVPVLVAELKALRARVAALEAAQVSKP